MAMANSDVREFSVGQMPFIISMHDDEEPTISLGERVVYLGTDEPEHGTIRWIGKLPEISDGLTVGVELDNAVGAIDGVWGGKKLFACKSMHGIVIDVKGLIKEVDFFGDDVDAASDSTTIPLTETPMAEAVKQHEDVSGSNDAGSEIRGLTGKDILQQMTNPNSTTSTSTQNASDNLDVEIEKFLSSKSISNGNRSFDRRVYARMFAECEVERWYEALEFDSDGMPDLGFREDLKTDKKKSSTLGTDVTITSKTKKERGGVFRFIRWLRRSKSSKSTGGSLKSSGGDGSRARTSSLDSMTSLSDSFHYIPVGVSCPEGIHRSCDTEQNDQVYEDLDDSLPPSEMTLVHPEVNKFNSLSRSVLNKRDAKPNHSLVAPGSSSIRRKKRRAPLPPTHRSVGSIAITESGRQGSRCRLHKVALSSTNNSGSFVDFPVGVKVEISNLRTSSREIASSTSAIYGHTTREATCVLKARSNSSLVKGKFVTPETSRKFGGANLPSEQQSLPSNSFKVHVKNKRKAPPPPTSTVSVNKLAVIEVDGIAKVNDKIIKDSLQDDAGDSGCIGNHNREFDGVVEPLNQDYRPTFMDELELQKKVLKDDIEGNVSINERALDNMDETTVATAGFTSVVTVSYDDEKQERNVTRQSSSDANIASLVSEHCVVLNPAEIPADISTEVQINTKDSLSGCSSPVKDNFENKLKVGKLNEANVDIESLQELVESLVKQYCSNVKANELPKMKNDDESNGAVNKKYQNKTSDIEEKPTVTSEVMPKKDAFVGEPISAVCNMLPETSNGCLPESKLKMSVNKKSSEDILFSSASNEVNDGKNKDKLNENLYEQSLYDYPKRLIDHCQLTEKALHKVERDVDNVEGLGSGPDSSTDDGSSGIYEPIGHFLRTRSEPDPDSTNDSLCNESVVVKNASVLLPNKFKENLSLIENNPSYGQKEFCTKKITKCEPKKSEKLIRRLSVNGQRQSLLKEEENKEEDSFGVDDCSSESSHKSFLHNDTFKNTAFSHQTPVYENLDMCDMKHGVSISKNPIDCHNGSYFPMMSPYWNPSLLPYSPYAVQPCSQIQAFTAMPGVPTGMSPVCVQHRNNYILPHHSCICPVPLTLSGVVDCDPYAHSVMAFDPCYTSRQAGVRKKSISVKLSTNPFLQEDVRKQHKSQNKSKGVPNMNNVPVTSETCEKGKITCASPISVKRVVSEKCQTESNTKVTLNGNVPPSPPPRVGSVGRSSRLAARCSFLKESTKFVWEKIGNDGRDVTCASENSAFSHTVDSNDSELKCIKSESPKLETCTPEAPNRKKSVDERRKGVDMLQTTRPIWNCSIVIGGVSITTPLNLWPLEYKLIAPELECIKAKLEGKTIPDERQQSGNATLNKLYKQLEISILNGNADDAAVLARQLAQSKIQTSVAENQSLVQAMDDSKVFLNMFVEDNVSHHGPIPIQVSSSMTVGELKKKIFREFEFPTGVQRWILGRKLANCDSDKLDHFGVDFNGCPVFLYITNPGNVDVKASDLLWDNDKREMEKMQAKTVSSQLKRESEATARQLEALKRDQLEMKPSQYCDDLLNNLLQPNSNLNTFQAGWHCSMCTLVNVPTRPGCEVCGFSRPAEYKVPEAYQMQESERIRLEEEKKVDRALELTLKEAEEKQRNENLQNYIQLMKLEEQDFVTNENAFECNICFCDIEPHEGVKLRDCLHMFCRDCLSNTVTYSEEATVKCPYRDEEYSCTSVLQEREIRALVSAEAFERHLQKSVVTAESQAQNSFHCKTPDCKGWCLYDDNVNEFHCPVCRHNNCLTCRVIHEGMNCRQYQDRLAAICTADEEAQKTKQAIDDMLKTGEALHCPNCNIIIMKKWGCDWICCSVCKLEICWVTKQPRWGPRGHGDTSSGCRCGLKGVRCHPNCNYCH